LPCSTCRATGARSSGSVERKPHVTHLALGVGDENAGRLGALRLEFGEAVLEIFRRAYLQVVDILDDVSDANVEALERRVGLHGDDDEPGDDRPVDPEGLARFGIER